MHSQFFRKHGVVHYCVPNIPSRVARTASFSLSNLLTPIILNAGDHGWIEEIITTTLDCDKAYIFATVFLLTKWWENGLI